MKLRKHMISRVLPDSIAEELGLEPGDRLVSVNGQPDGRCLRLPVSHE